MEVCGKRKLPVVVVVVFVLLVALSDCAPAPKKKLVRKLTANDNGRSNMLSSTLLTDYWKERGFHDSFDPLIASESRGKDLLVSGDELEDFRGSSKIRIPRGRLTPPAKFPQLVSLTASISIPRKTKRLHAHAKRRQDRRPLTKAQRRQDMEILESVTLVDGGVPTNMADGSMKILQPASSTTAHRKYRQEDDVSQVQYMEDENTPQLNREERQQQPEGEASIQTSYHVLPPPSYFQNQYQGQGKPAGAYKDPKSLSQLTMEQFQREVYQTQQQQPHQPPQHYQPPQPQNVPSSVAPPQVLPLFLIQKQAPQPGYQHPLNPPLPPPHHQQPSSPQHPQQHPHYESASPSPQPQYQQGPPVHYHPQYESASPSPQPQYHQPAPPLQHPQYESASPSPQPQQYQQPSAPPPPSQPQHYPQLRPSQQPHELPFNAQLFQQQFQHPFAPESNQPSPLAQVTASILSAASGVATAAAAALASANTNNNHNHEPIHIPSPSTQIIQARHPFAPASSAFPPTQLPHLVAPMLSAASSLQSEVLLPTTTPLPSTIPPRPGVVVDDVQVDNNQLIEPENLANQLTKLYETGKKILYFPKGVVDTVDTLLKQMERNPMIAYWGDKFFAKVFGDTSGT